MGLALDDPIIGEPAEVQVERNKLIDTRWADEKMGEPMPPSSISTKDGKEGLNVQRTKMQEKYSCTYETGHSKTLSCIETIAIRHVITHLLDMLFHMH